MAIYNRQNILQAYFKRITLWIISTNGGCI